MAGGSGQACAACKHQRRKCYPDCALARYFPAERAQQFNDVHRLFGVSNLMKFYNAVDPEQRDRLVDSMTYEGEMRRRDPVHGCVAVIRDLCARIDAAKRDLGSVHRQIALCKRAALLQQQQQQPPFLVPHQPLPLPPLSLPQDFQSYTRPPPPVFSNMANRTGAAVGKMKMDDVGALSHLPLPFELEEVKPFDRAILDHAMNLLQHRNDVYDPENTGESYKELKPRAGKSDGVH